MQYFVTEFRLEVLSTARDVADLDIGQLAYQITDGDCSGQMTLLTQPREVTETEMAELLVAQGSDPGFLIPGEDDDDDGPA